MPTIDELGTFVAAATSQVLGTTLFKGEMPDSPDACSAMFETPGSAPDHVFGQAAIAVEYPRAQLRFRGEELDDETPRAKAELAFRALASLSNQLLTGTRWLEARPLQSPFLLLRDTKRRAVFAFNVQISKELSV